MSETSPKKGKGKKIFVSLVLGLVLLCSIAGLVLMVMEPLEDATPTDAENFAKVTLEAEAPTPDEMMLKDAFTVGE